MGVRGGWGSCTLSLGHGRLPDALFGDLVQSFLHPFMVDEEATASLPSVFVYLFPISSLNK